MKSYPRILYKGSEPYDPLELAKETEKIACKDNARKYTDFYATGVYGGIATGYTVGCCLRCYYCWVGWSRDFPERLGEFYSAEKAFENLKKAAHNFGVEKMRISGAEPTLGRRHLIDILKLFEESEFELFILETNGILFGADESYVKDIIDFKKLHVRVSLKAGTKEGYEERTGAIGQYYDLPYHAIEYLKDSGISFHVAAMTDTRTMPKRERKILIQKLATIDSKIAEQLEEEKIDPYETTLKRMKKMGNELQWINAPYYEK